MSKELQNTNSIIKINYENDQPLVYARDLHEFLEVGTDFRHWFPRMCEYGFTKGQDFNMVKNDRVEMEGDRTVKRTVDDATLTIEMAKEICMLQRNDRGKAARQYFIQLEKEWNSPERVMARALQIANKTIESLKPKAEYFDMLVERNTLTNFRDTAKEFHIPPHTFTQWLVDQGFLYRTQKKKQLRPYQPYVEKGYFAIKDGARKNGKWSGVQTLITPTGKEAIRLLLEIVPPTSNE